MTAARAGNVGFLSTPPSWVATLPSMSTSAPKTMFLSTPPSWVATLIFPGFEAVLHVSIHATLVGGDRRQQPSRPARSCFYPRHPRGWRRRLAPPAMQPYRCFYPRHPRGWRRQDGQGGGYVGYVSIHATLVGGDYTTMSSLKQPIFVSIHATLVGGDRQGRPQLPPPDCFYPRHPRGWRRKNPAIPIPQTKFLSTPPSWVATAGEHRRPAPGRFLSTPPSWVATLQ